MSNAAAIAAGVDFTRRLESHEGWQVMPYSCSMISALSTSARNPVDASRQMASICAESHEPALPMLANNSKGLVVVFRVGVDGYVTGSRTASTISGWSANFAGTFVIVHLMAVSGFG